MRAAILIVALIAWSVALPTLGNAQDAFETRGERFEFSGVSFPSVADTFAVMMVQRFPNPSAGTQLQYRSPIAPRMPFDIYIYEADLRAGTEEAVRQEFDTALEGVEAYSREDVEVTTESSDTITITAVDGVSYRGWRGQFRLDRGSASQTSLLYVFVKNGWFFKYRISVERALRTFLEPRVQAFLRQTLADVAIDGG